MNLPNQSLKFQQNDYDFRLVDLELTSCLNLTLRTTVCSVTVLTAIDSIDRANSQNMSRHKVTHGPWAMDNANDRKWTESGPEVDRKSFVLGSRWLETGKGVKTGPFEVEEVQ